METTANDYSYYPYQWAPSPDCSIGMIIQNKDGNKPASCEEIVPTGGKDNCDGYVGYYPDNETPEFHHCTNNTWGNGCRDALVRPTPCRVGVNDTGYEFEDKSAWQTMGWTCEKPPGDLRTKLTSTYYPINPIVDIDLLPSEDEKKKINFVNMCGNSWGDSWGGRCLDKTRDWPKCSTLKNKGNCDEVIGCKWIGQCVPQTCPDMIQNDLVCDSKLCSWNPYCDDPNTCGPEGDPPRGFTGRGSVRKP
jgi:hypothetical protein